jgi:hypothetical protein
MRLARSDLAGKDDALPAVDSQVQEGASILGAVAIQKLAIDRRGCMTGRLAREKNAGLFQIIESRCRGQSPHSHASSHIAADAAWLMGDLPGALKRFPPRTTDAIALKGRADRVAFGVIVKPLFSRSS